MDLSNINLDATVTTSVRVKLEPTTDSPSWQGYPQSLFGNWTPDQVRRSQMLTKCSETQPSTIYWMDVLNDGRFCSSNIGDSRTKKMTTLDDNDFCSMLQEKVSIICPIHASLGLKCSFQRLDNIRVQTLCVDNLTKPVLQMLGKGYEHLLLGLIVLKGP